MGAVLGDGLDGQLVLTHRRLLHDGDRLQRRRLGALDDATGGAQRTDAGNRLHFHWTERKQILSINHQSISLTQ